MQVKTELGRFLERRPEKSSANTQRASAIRALADAAALLSACIGQATPRTVQDSGERIAADLFEESLQRSGIVLQLAGRDRSPPARVDDAGLVVSLLPLEGASKSGPAMTCSSLFSIHSPNTTVPPLALSRTNLSAAGLIVYGPQTLLLLGLDEAVSLFQLDRETGEFGLVEHSLRLPAQRYEFSIDVANYRFWHSGIRHYFDDCIAGFDGPMSADYAMHWSDSLGVEALRILLHGGIYLSPDDHRAGHENGRHDLLFEAIPLAFLVEMAGGRASDGYAPILDRPIPETDTPTALIFGSVEEVDRLLAYVGDGPGKTNRFPLFVTRGLLRN